MQNLLQNKLLLSINSILELTFFSNNLTIFKPIKKAVLVVSSVETFVTVL